MIELDKNKKSIGIIGCSYTHWHDGNCELESYPALIAKKYNEYNVVDLSMPGSSNDSAYIRLRSFEKLHNIKFDKVIFQITHYGRFLHMPQYNVKNTDIFREYRQLKNYIYTDGNWKDENWDTITSSYLISPSLIFKVWYRERLDFLSNHFRIKVKDLQKWLYHYLESDMLSLVLEKEMHVINGIYGKDNVLLFSWHAGIDSSDLTSFEKCDFPENYIGSMAEMIGPKTFFKLGIDDAPHYDRIGNGIVFKHLKPRLDKLLTP